MASIKASIILFNTMNNDIIIYRCMTQLFMHSLQFEYCVNTIKLLTQK